MVWSSGGSWLGFQILTSLPILYFHEGNPACHGKCVCHAIGQQSQQDLARTQVKVLVQLGPQSAYKGTKPSPTERGTEGRNVATI